MTSIVSIIAIAYAAIVGLMYVGQRNMLYFPTPENHLVEEPPIYWQSGSETIKVWRIGSGKPALLYFGGNAEDVALNIADFEQDFPNHTQYLVNYRGYGGSSGKPTESGLMEDALNIYDQIKASHDRIVVMGRSLGSAVAVQLAAQREADKLILITPFDSILNVAKGIYPFFPVSLLLKDRFDGVSQVNNIQAPVLVLMAEDDGVIPSKRTDALVAAIPENQRSVVVIKAATHNDIQHYTDYRQALISFINK